VSEKLDIAAGNGSHLHFSHISYGTIRHFSCDTIAPALNNGPGSKFHPVMLGQRYSSSAIATLAEPILIAAMSIKG
jgi:hypothetical protein